jgi:hypothetical protein
VIEAKTHYYRVEMPKIRQKITEFKEEIGNVGKCMRLSYLYERLFELDVQLSERQERYEASLEQDQPYIERGFIASYIPEIEKEIKKLEREINFIVSSSEKGDGKITPEMIERAKDYPLENLIEVKHGKALCCFHDDHNPSMGIKNNRYHCFACGAKGDPIDFISKRDGVSFHEAVRWLSKQ